MENANLNQGTKYLVATFGLAKVWNEATFLYKREATPTTNELYYFQNEEGVYPILDKDLIDRVRKI